MKIDTQNATLRSAKSEAVPPARDIPLEFAGEIHVRRIRNILNRYDWARWTRVA